MPIDISAFSFQGLPERESSVSWLWISVYFFFQWGRSVDLDEEKGLSISLLEESRTSINLGNDHEFIINEYNL